MPHVILASNPFQPQEAETFTTHAGQTIRQWLEGHFPDFVEFPVATICVVNGNAKLRSEWGTYVLQENDVVVFSALPQWTVAAMIVMAIATVASAAVALLMPKPGVPDQSQADSVFSLKGQHNQLKLGNPIESSYGRCRLYPSYAAKPYTVFKNNEQYQFNLYCLGHGEFEVETPKYEETPITDFDDVTYAVYGPGETVELFPDNVYTSAAVSALELLAPNEAGYSGYYGPFPVSEPGTQCDYLEVDFTFPAGLYKMSDGGKQGWVAISFQIQYQLIDDSGNALGDWTDFLGSMGKDGNTTTAIRWTYAQSVPMGRYQLRARRLSDKDESAGCANTICWDAMRCFLPSTGVYPGVTVVAVRAKASNNLNDNVANRFNVWATRKLPVWNGTTWSAPTATRNAIWAFCDVFRASYGARLGDAFLRLPKMLELATTLAAEGRNFDYTFDQKSTVWEAARLIARSFRGVPIPSGTQVSIVRDTTKTVPEAVFTPENIVKGSFSYTINSYMPGEYDSVLVRYTSSETWREETVLCKVGDDDGDAPEEMQIPGVTDRVVAWREGMYYRAQKKYRPNQAKFTTGTEGHIPSYLSYIYVNHPTPKWGSMAGVVESIGADRRTVQLSEPVDFTGLTSPVLGLRAKDGSFSGPYSVVKGASPKEVVSNTDIPDEFFFDGIHEKPFFMFGSLTNFAKGMVVTSLSPNSDKNVDVTCIEYTDLPFANDNANPDDTESYNGTDLGPAVPTLDCSTVTVEWVAQTDNALVSWRKADGALTYIVESSTDGETWKYEGATPYFSILIPAIEGEFHVRVQAVGRAGSSGWCVKDFTDFGPVLQDPVTALAAQSGETYLLRSGDGSMLAQINVTWALPSETFADSDGHVEILYKKSTDTTFKAKILGAGATQYLITPVSDGDVVTIKVRAISYLGVKSAFAQVVHTVTGKVALPGEPTNIALSSVNIPLLNMEATDLFPAAPYYGTRVTWTGATDADLSHYELKATATDSDEATNVVWRSPQNISTDHIEKVFGTEVVLYSIVTGYGGYVRVRSVDTSGNASAWVRCVTTCDSACSISSVISSAETASLLGRKSAGAGPVERVPTDTSLAVSGAGVSVVAQKYTDPATQTAGFIRLRKNGDAIEWSVNGTDWTAFGSGERFAAIRPISDSFGWSVPIYYSGTGYIQIRKNATANTLEWTPDGGTTVHAMGGGGASLPEAAAGEMLICENAEAGLVPVPVDTSTTLSTDSLFRVPSTSAVRAHVAAAIGSAVIEGAGDSHLWDHRGVLMWFDSGTTPQGTAGPVSAAGDPIVAWSDKSRHTISAIQLTASARTTWTPNAINGHGAITVNAGTEQGLIIEGLPSHRLGLVGDFTIFVLGRRGDSTNVAPFFGGMLSARLTLYSYPPDGNLRLVGSASTYADAGSAWTLTTEWQLIEIRQRGNSVYFIRNGAVVSTTGAIVSPSNTWDMTIGVYFSGMVVCRTDIAALIVLDGSANSIADTVRSYLLNFAGNGD